MFYRLNTDRTRANVALEGTFAGPFSTPCWIICGGPSLSELPIEEISRSPAPKFAVNLAGTGLLRPNFWTSYDPTVRFLRSVYLDPGITKFVHGCRAMDVVPETNYKVCEAPSTYFFDRQRDTGFANFLGHRNEGPHVTDWQDSLIQAIDIAWRLGFRELLLAGCDMFIEPSDAWKARAASVGVDYQPGELLKDFTRRCEKANLSRDKIESLSPPQQYHFEESKPLASAIQTDFHYFRVAQYLRLSRRAMALSGIKLTSVTSHSRLNDYFDYETVPSVISRLSSMIGDPQSESTRGLYTDQTCRKPTAMTPMRDFPPHFYKKIQEEKNAAPAPKPSQEKTKSVRAKQMMQQLEEIAVPINELG